MKTHLIQNVEGLISIEDDWVDLLTRVSTKTPFQQPAYNRHWWSTLGGGEWDEGELWVFAGYEPDDRMIGLAPLFLTLGAEGTKELRLIGSKEISDYLDLISEDGQRANFIDALLLHLKDDPPDGFQRLILDNLLGDSATIPSMKTQATATGWHISQERIEPSPLLTLPSSFDAYLENLDSKQRREFKRKMRRVVDYPARVTWRIEDKADTVTRDIDTFLDLMEKDAEKRDFLTEPMREHFRNLAVMGAEADWLQLAFLEVSKEPVFGYMNFVAQNRIWVYNSGFDPDHFALSPGWVLMGYLIQWAIERGLEAIDFMRGDEDYKYRLGGSDRYVHRLVLEP
jgi:CelD/BcsL family acetyltransferase involved in cellulose biosynthesis